MREPTVQMTATGAKPVCSPETLKEVRRMVSFVNRHLDDAALRPQDVSWWERNSASLIRDMEEVLRRRALSDQEARAEVEADPALDEAVNAELGPRAATIVASYREKVREKVIAERLKSFRNWAHDSVWYLWVAGFIVGFERIQLEGIHHGRSAQRARSAMRAGIAVMAMAVGTQKILENEDGEDDD